MLQHFPIEFDRPGFGAIEGRGDGDLVCGCTADDRGQPQHFGIIFISVEVWCEQDEQAVTGQHARRGNSFGPFLHALP
jgi:hypothetical protein